MKNMDVRRKFISIMTTVYTVTAIIFFSSLASSQSTKSLERMEFYNGVRALGMGGVVVATVNDETALISNPAALGKLRNKYFTVADPEIHANKLAYEYLAEEPEAIYDIDPQTLLDFLLLNPDEHYHFRGNIFPSLVVPNFGIGVLASWTANGEVITADSEFDIFYRNDYTAIIGYNLRLFDGRIKIGFNARYIDRAEVDTQVASSSTNLEWDNFVKEGTGVASDVGLLLTAPWDFLPTIGAVLRDVGNTSYTLSAGTFYDSTERPDTTRSTLDVGMSITPILAKHIRWQIGVELRDALEAYSLDEDDTDVETKEYFMRRVHGGMEFNIYDKIFLRGGYHQDYWTAGLEIAGPIFSFQAASYGEQIGDSDDKREDRRYVAKFSIRF